MPLLNIKMKPKPLKLLDVYKLIQLYKNEHVVRKKLFKSNNLTFVNRPFPFDVSENLTRIFIEKKEKKACIWTNDERHDLYLPRDDKKIEVKAFSSETQQISFTKSQTFQMLYVLDCRSFMNDYYTVHSFDFSSEDLNEMKIGIDSIVVKESKKTNPLRCSLKKLINFSKTKNEFRHEITHFRLK